MCRLGGLVIHLQRQPHLLDSPVGDRLGLFGCPPQALASVYCLGVVHLDIPAWNVRIGGNNVLMDDWEGIGAEGRI